MVRVTDRVFAQCYQDAAFRESLESMPNTRDKLCKKHLMELMNLREFRDSIADHGDRAMAYLQHFIQYHKDEVAKFNRTAK